MSCLRGHYCRLPASLEPTPEKSWILDIDMFSDRINEPAKYKGRIGMRISVRVPLDARICDQLEPFGNFDLSGYRSMPERDPLVEFVLISDISKIQMKCPRLQFLGCDDECAIGHLACAKLFIFISGRQGNARL